MNKLLCFPSAFWIIHSLHRSIDFTLVLDSCYCYSCWWWWWWFKIRWTYDFSTPISGEHCRNDFFGDHAKTCMTAPALLVNNGTSLSCTPTFQHILHRSIDFKLVSNSCYCYPWWWCTKFNPPTSLNFKNILHFPVTLQLHVCPFAVLFQKSEWESITPESALGSIFISNLQQFVIGHQSFLS